MFKFGFENKELDEVNLKGRAKVLEQVVSTVKLRAIISGSCRASFLSVCGTSVGVEVDRHCGFIGTIFLPFLFSPSQPFHIEELLKSKTYLGKVD